MEDKTPVERSRIRNKMTRTAARQRKIVKIKTGKPGRPRLVDMGPAPFILQIAQKYDESLNGKLPFEWLKAFVQQMGIQSRSEYWAAREYFKWGDWAPKVPNRTYKEWQGWNDFLNTTNVFVSKSLDPSLYRDYWSAVRYMRGLNLQSIKEWKDYLDSGELPLDIPENPRVVYKEHWKGFKEFLGFGSAKAKVADYEKQEFWVLYDDGRPGVFWWVRLDIDQLAQVKTYEGVRILRIYQYERELGDVTHQILNKHSSVFEDDPRERETNNLHPLVFDLDCQLLRTQ
ncbi:hypothetical protein D3C75_587850 [compost metagenome]